MAVQNNQIISATKWSSVTELAAKLISPISNIVLARLLTPQAFGVVATITMLITFFEVFTDAGFQKYIIQHEFSSEKEKVRSTNVAFLTNLFMSLAIWGIIIICRNPLATLVGNPGLGDVLAVACVSIILEAFSSIQMAIYKRDFDFKTLFKIRMVAIMIPLLVTIPLAFALRSYWALIIGTIAKDVLNAILLTYYSKWKPSLYYSFTELKKMFSFTFWSMCEAISIWLTGYVDIFIVGIYLNEHILGIYKTSMTTVGQIFGLITAATTPIIFSYLSRLQTDTSQLKKMFLKCQRYIAIIIFPIGVIVFSYSSVICAILLGPQWTEADGFIGLWGLMSAITIIFSHYNSEVFRALGKPKLSLIVQLLHLIVLIPALLISVKYGYKTLYITRSLVRIEAILVSVIVLNILIHTSLIGLIKNVRYSLFSSLVMFIVSYLIGFVFNSFLLSFAGMLISCATYVGVLYIFPESREQFLNVIHIIINKDKKQQNNQGHK